jgi:hypothetical protein
MLRKTAVALDPAGLRSKIILPNDQVRYLAIDSTRATEDEIRARLQEATPYNLDELAWDVVRGGGRTYIAAVARETLDEAENFAVDHRFGPVSFAAVPEEFTFVGEPFLGQTRAATLLLPPGDTVERDAIPVRLNTAPTRPAKTEPEPGAGADVAEAPVEPPAQEPAPAAEPVPETPGEPVEATASEPAESVAESAPVENPKAPEPAETETPAADLAKAETPPSAPEAEPAAGPVASEAPVTTAPESEPLAVTADPVAPPSEQDRTPDAAPEKTPEPAPVQADIDAEQAPPAAVAPVEEPEPAPVFASRARSKRTLVADTKVVPPAPPVAAPPRRAPAARGAEEPVFSRRTPPPVSMPAPLAPPVAAEIAAPTEPVLQAPAPANTPPATPPAPSVAGRLSIESVAPAPRAVTDPTAPRITGVALSTAERPTVVPFAPLRPATPPPTPPAPAATARIAAFPARSKPAEPAPDAAKLALGAAAPRGKPRFLGLILTAILVVLMLIVALWVGRTDNVVSRFFGGGDADATAVAAAVPVAIPLVQPSAAVEEPAAAEVTTAALPDASAQDAAVADEELVPAAVEPVAADAGATSDLPDAVAAAAAAALVAEAMSTMTEDTATVDALARPAPGGEIVMVTPEEADAFYAATGVWLRAPRLTVTPQAEDLAALAVSPGDAAVADRAGVALPPVGPDPGLVAQANPPPAGTRLPRDERGFILATPEGTVTPDGLVIYAGQPPVLPQVRPGTVAPEPDATETVEIADIPLTDQTLTEPPLRPVARPGSAAPVADTLPEAEDALPGGVALTDLRPEPRPESVAALAPPPPLPSFEGPRPALRPDGLAPEGATSDVAADAPEPVDPQAALAQTLASIVEGAGDPLATATPQAVAVARRPDSRPNNFARVVQQQSERLARATEAAQQQAAPASLGTPEEAAETEEVEVATAAPTSITPRSVSDAATMANVMALREINLIGVYGTPNDRRALVRLANGRYVRVSVGDSLDGGQVAAISDNALNYIRRGRTITLEIPGG